MSILSLSQKLNLTLFQSISFLYAIILCILHGVNGIVSVIFNSYRMRGLYSASIALPSLLCLTIIKIEQPTNIQEIIFYFLLGYTLSLITLIIFYFKFMRRELLNNFPDHVKQKSFHTVQQWIMLTSPIMFWGFFVWLQQNIDKLVINQLLSDAELAQYVIHLQIAYTPIIALVATIIQYITPLLYQIYESNGKPRKFLRNVYLLFILMYLSTSFLVWSTGDLIVNFLSSGTVEENSVLLQMFLLTSYVYAVLQVVNLQLTGSYIIKPRLPFQIIASFVTVGLVYYFTKNFGLVGSVFGILSGLLVKLIFSVFLRFRYLNEAS